MTTPKNPRKPVHLGVTGERVAQRLHEIRENVRPRMSLRALEQELTRIGHPISADGLSKIEIGKRKVDVDDLIALAIALRVSPLALLLPMTKNRWEHVRLTETVEEDAGTVWDWARSVGSEPYLESLPDGHAKWDRQDSLPQWTESLMSVQHPSSFTALLRQIMSTVPYLSQRERVLLTTAVEYGDEYAQTGTTDEGGGWQRPSETVDEAFERLRPPKAEDAPLFSGFDRALRRARGTTPADLD